MSEINTTTQEEEKQTVELEGFGGLAGQTTKATVIKRLPAAVIVLEVEGAEGKKAQFKFSLQDGMAKGADASKGGFKISETALAELKGNKNKGTTPGTPRVGKEDPNPSAICKCGCGGTTKPKRNFVQGHDAKAHSMVLKFLRGQIPETELKDAAPYIQENVADSGGYASKRVEGKTVQVDGETLMGKDGRPLTGSAALAAKAKREREKNAAAAETAAPVAPEATPEPVAA